MLKNEKLIIDLRKADKEDMFAVAKILMNVSAKFSTTGYKVYLKRSQKSSPCSKPVSQ